MRIACVDLVFSWPPPGGAQADLLYTVRGLAELGHEVHLFAPSYDFMWRFGSFSPDELPFPATPIELSWKAFNRRDVPARFRDAVEAWRPDVVFIGFGRHLKPYVMDALAQYPIISRYYMYEHLCMRDFCLFEQGDTCPNDIFQTPEACRQCNLKCWEHDIRSGKQTTYSREYLLANTYTPAYQRLFADTFRKIRVAIVNNTLAKERLEDHCRDVRIIPGGIDIEDYAPPSHTDKPAAERTVILMTGRADDARKGMEVVLEAGLGLSQTRDDFEVWVTYSEQEYDYEWLKYVGWRDHNAIADLYRQAGICVVPSVWEEPFGLVAVEAMAAGLPVCASRVGGLKGIVRDHETGLLFEPGDSVGLALCLDKLLDDAPLRSRMGKAGRERVEIEYNWAGIVPKYWPSLLEEVVG